MPTDIPDRTTPTPSLLLIICLAFYACSLLAMLIAPVLPLPEMMALASP